MDLWTYIFGLKRWWWLVILVPVGAFALASLMTPAAKWVVTWDSVVVFDGSPQYADGPQYTDFVVLDDMTHLLASDVLGDRVYLALPESVTKEYSRSEVGEMFSTYRHARFVEINVAADKPEIAEVVAQVTEEALPEAINFYLLPPDFPRIPGDVHTVNPRSEPELQTRERMLKVGGVTAAGIAGGFAAAGVAEWLRLSYREKYGER